MHESKSTTDNKINLLEDPTPLLDLIGSTNDVIEYTVQPSPGGFGEYQISGDGSEPVMLGDWYACMADQAKEAYLADIWGAVHRISDYPGAVIVKIVYADDYASYHLLEPTND